MSNLPCKIEIGKTLREKIKKLERKKGGKVTVQNVADSVGVSSDYIRKILNNKRVGSYRVLLSLATFLGCSVDDLIMPKNKTMSK